MYAHSIEWVFANTDCAHTRTYSNVDWFALKKKIYTLKVTRFSWMPLYHCYTLINCAYTHMYAHIDCACVCTRSLYLHTHIHTCKTHFTTHPKASLCTVYTPKTPYIHRKEPYIHRKEPYIYRKEPYIHRKEPYIHRKELYIHRKEPYKHGKKPYMCKTEPQFTVSLQKSLTCARQSLGTCKA